MAYSRGEYYIYGMRPDDGQVHGDIQFMTSNTDTVVSGDDMDVFLYTMLEQRKPEELKDMVANGKRLWCKAMAQPKWRKIYGEHYYKQYCEGE